MLYGYSTIASGPVQPPVAIKFCPEPIRINAPAQSNSATVFWKEPVAQNPANILSVDKSQTPGQRFFIGSTVVTYTLTDKGGRTGTCSFDVTGKYQSRNFKLKKQIISESRYN